MGEQCGVLDNQAGWRMLTKSTQRGFSLIELMVVIVIVGILFALGVPSYSGWIQNQQIRAAAESVLNGIQLARSEAVKNNGRARFVLCNAPLSSWQVLTIPATAPAVGPAPTAECGAGTATELRMQERSSQEGSRLAQIAVTPNGATTVTFNSFGRVVANADASTSITQVDVSTPTGDRPLRITLGAAGNTRMCDPSTLLAATDPRHC